MMGQRGAAGKKYGLIFGRKYAIIYVVCFYQLQIFMEE